jgi:hypothetical protein
MADRVFADLKGHDDRSVTPDDGEADGVLTA